MLRISSLLTAIVILSLSLLSCGMFRPADTESIPAKSTSPKETAAPTETSEETTASPLPIIPAPEPGAPKTVCIDAGHGYNDPGCTTEYLNGRYEREIVAEYADSLKAELESRGYRVILLHTEDEYVTAADVAAGADKVGVTYKADKLVDDGRFAAYNRTIWLNVLHRYTYIDAFVSIHIDTFTGDESVRGTRIYYCSENGYSEDSSRLCSEMATAIGTDLPDMNARSFAKNSADAYIVTKYSQMPSALIEMGFATNPTDAKNILDTQWQEDFVSAMADGITAFVEK